MREHTYVGNDIRIMTTRDVSMIAQSMVTSKVGMMFDKSWIIWLEVMCLQKYVKSVGPKAFICRTCWRKDRSPYVWIITNNADYDSNGQDEKSDLQRVIVNPRIMGSCSIVHSIRGRYVEETTPYIVNIVKYMERNIPGAQFEEFIADFVKDESETWWLINVRGFVLTNKMNVQPREFLFPDVDEEEDGPKVSRITKKKVS